MTTFNRSTTRFVKNTLEKANRHLLLATKTKLWCPRCKSVEKVLDVFPNSTVSLACNPAHRRPLFIRKASDIADYEKAVKTYKPLVIVEKLEPTPSWLDGFHPGVSA